jgi:tRNA A37 threonylcarbamoyladenosine biosynthesis protein TsaE
VGTEKGVENFYKASQAVGLHFSLYNIVTNSEFYNLSEKEYFSSNGKELCLIINKTHAGNYNRLLKIKKKKAQNLHLSINTINFDKSRLHIPGIMAYTIRF